MVLQKIVVKQSPWQAANILWKFFLSFKKKKPKPWIKHVLETKRKDEWNYWNCAIFVCDTHTCMLFCVYINAQTCTLWWILTHHAVCAYGLTSLPPHLTIYEGFDQTCFLLMLAGGEMPQQMSHITGLTIVQQSLIHRLCSVTCSALLHFWCIHKMMHNNNIGIHISPFPSISWAKITTHTCASAHTFLR